ncbi:hypothetical protein ABAC460_16885 [Asticcacaulis sp. AC460]|nr:hypothetical protein ABAC460_16885 [Asticcacaulis sp. AC460]
MAACTEVTEFRLKERTEYDLRQYQLLRFAREIQLPEFRAFRVAAQRGFGAFRGLIPP